MASEIITYKNKVIYGLINSSDIVQAIDNQYDTIEDPDDLIYTSIFPYIRIPNTVETVRTFILLSVDVNKINNYNKTFHELWLTIWVLSHQDHMKTNYGSTRIDYISDKIEKLFNLQSGFGYKDLNLMRNKERVLDNKHLYREMVFTTQDVRKDVGGSG